MRTCFETEIAGFKIILSQIKYDSFVVTYGSQVERALPYDKAASKLGEAIMHALHCEGKIK